MDAAWRRVDSALEALDQTLAAGASNLLELQDLVAFKLYDGAALDGAFSAKLLAAKSQWEHCWALLASLREVQVATRTQRANLPIFGGRERLVGAERLLFGTSVVLEEAVPLERRAATTSGTSGRRLTVEQAQRELTSSFQAARDFFVQTEASLRAAVAKLDELSVLVDSVATRSAAAGIDGDAVLEGVRKSLEDRRRLLFANPLVNTGKWQVALSELLGPVVGRLERIEQAEQVLLASMNVAAEDLAHVRGLLGTDAPRATLMRLKRFEHWLVELDGLRVLHERSRVRSDLAEWHEQFDGFRAAVSAPPLLAQPPTEVSQRTVLAGKWQGHYSRWRSSEFAGDRALNTFSEEIEKALSSSHWDVADRLIYAFETRLAERAARAR